MLTSKEFKKRWTLGKLIASRARFRLQGIGLGVPGLGLGAGFKCLTSARFRCKFRVYLDSLDIRKQGSPPNVEVDWYFSKLPIYNPGRAPCSVPIVRICMGSASIRPLTARPCDLGPGECKEIMVSNV